MGSKSGVDTDLKVSRKWDNEKVLDSRTTADGKVQRFLHSLSGFERNKLFLNSQGKDFIDISALSGADSIADGRAFSIWDYDHDGWQDIALINTNSPQLQIFHNNHGSASQPENGFVAIRFVGGNDSAHPSSQWSCRDGYGAMATVRAGDYALIRELRCGEGFSSQNSSTLIVGIGANQVADAISIRWPSGKKQVAENIRSGCLITFFENPDQSDDRSGYRIGDYQPTAVADHRDDVATDIGPFMFDVPELQNDGAELRVFFAMATWCESCRTHVDFIADLKSQFADQRVAFYGVPVDLADDAEKLADYQQKLKVPYVILSDLNSDQRLMTAEHLQTQLNSAAMPSTIITDSTGHPLEEHLGIPTVSEISRLLDSD